MTTPEGHVWLVGAGPGDPGLLTLNAVRALGEADLVLYDALVSPAILRHAPAAAESRFVGKRSGAHGMSQAGIEELIVIEALAGKRVVRLKGGDPFVFGRGGEEALACARAGVPFTVVPGVTSAIAAPAYAGIPVTHRGLASSFMVVTGSEPGDAASTVDWAAAAHADSLVILMGVATLAENMDRLIASGRSPDTPVACIRWGTRPDQQVVRSTVGGVAAAVREAGLASPFVTVVGDAVALADDLAWFAPGPLAGKRVVVTRARAQSSDLVAKLESLGAYVVEAPVIGIRPSSGELVMDERVTSRWDWIVFSSANGVTAFFDALASGGRDARSLATTRVAAVGAATADALRARGLIADFVPTRATSECLAAGIDRIAGARVLLPVSALTDGRMADALRRRGGLVEQVAVYENVLQPLDAERLREVAEADAVTFTSASTAKNLTGALGEVSLPAGAKLVSIGPQTSAAVRQVFGRVDCQAREPSLDALVEAVKEVLLGDAD